MKTQPYSRIILVAVFLMVFVGMPASMHAQTPPLPPPAPALPAPSAVPTTESPGSRILPERVALIPTISTFTQSQKPGDRGEGVRNLQRFLNQHGFIVAETGIGSPGQESDYYGPLTRNAVARYQKAYAAYVLVPAGTKEASGVFGPGSMTYANELLQRGFVNLFPVGGNPTTSNSTQLASVASSEALLDVYIAALSSLKEQTEKIKSLLSAFGQ